MKNLELIYSNYLHMLHGVYHDDIQTFLLKYNLLVTLGHKEALVIEKHFAIVFYSFDKPFNFYKNEK